MQTNYFIKLILLAFVLSFCNSCAKKTTHYSIKQATKDLRWYSTQIPDTEIVEKIGRYIIVTTLPNTYIRRTRRFHIEKKQITHQFDIDLSKYDTREGLYQEWWDNGEIKTKGRYDSSKKVGTWIEYNYDGSIISEIQYNGEIQDTILFSRIDLMYNHSKSKKAKTLQPAKFVGTYPNDTLENWEGQWKGRLRNHVLKNWTGPNFIQGTENYGEMNISFKIDKSGKVIDIEVQRGINEEVSEAAVRVMQTMPDWEPALRNGLPIISEYSLSILIPKPKYKAKLNLQLSMIEH